MVIIDLFLITVIVVCIVDISGFIDSLKSGIKWVLTKGKMNNSDYRLKPIDCSLCLSFYSCITYMLVTHNFTLEYITLALVLACFASVIKDAILLVEDVFIKINRWIYKWIDNED